MNEFSLHSITRFSEFLEIKDEWCRFTNRYFPHMYARTHSWLSSWWETYHPGGAGAIYVQRSHRAGLVAAAPLHIRRESFGGFPVRILTLLGCGIGTEDFLISPESKNFIPEVMTAVGESGWDIIRMSRLSEHFAERLEETAVTNGWKVEKSESTDFLVSLPSDFEEYLSCRSRKFRRNLNQAENRLEREGSVEFLVLDPFQDTERVLESGRNIARQSWQYGNGVSHFCEEASNSLYANLTRRQRGAGGEDFNLLLVSGKPVAYLLGCRRGRTYYAIDTAFHRDFQSISAGRVLFARVIGRLIGERSTDVFDFEGAGHYKDDYATDSRTVKSMILYNRNPYAQLIRLFRRSRLYSLVRKYRDVRHVNRPGKGYVKEDANESTSSNK